MIKRHFGIVVLVFFLIGCGPGGTAALVLLLSKKKKTTEKPPPLQITTTTLPDGYEGQVGYSATLTASGGKSGATLTWTIVSGSLPGNLSFNSDGTITGDIVSGTAGTYSITVEVTDGIGTA